jgi:hypothetical protein
MLLPFAAACFFQGEGDGVPTTALFLKKVSSPGNALAIFHPDEELPPPSGGPSGEAQGPDSADAGTTVEVDVSGNGGALVSLGGIPFDRVFVSLVGADGFYELAFPTQVTSATILLSLDEDLPGDVDALQVVFELADDAQRGAALVGEPFTKTIGIERPGLRVTLTWDNPEVSTSDLDLEVQEPCGSLVFPGSDPSPFGGTGDFDANAQCEEDLSEENATWPAGMAPQGTFTVRVRGNSQCDGGSTPFVVRVRKEGEEPTSHPGVLVCNDGCDVESFTFSVTSGPPCDSGAQAGGR